MAIVAIIPARGGSKRLPRKNIHPFFGRSLLEYSIKACRSSKHIDRGVFVSTDDSEIATVARSLGAEVIERPTHLAEDHVWTQDVLQHAVQYLNERGIDFDSVARIHASPYVAAEKIDEAIEKLDSHNLWEVFSVNRQGVEDAVIHILKKQCVSQRALSVYKGVVQTDYADIHTREELEIAQRAQIDAIERDSLNFLQQLEQQYHHKSLRNEMRYIMGRSLSLWVWQKKISLYRRWNALVNSNEEFKSFLNSRDCARQARDLTILDIGCGFGMYWPIIRLYGFRKFVGIDLFDMRRQEHYFEAAQRYVERFCGDCETTLIQDDVRNMHNHNLPYNSFDVIINVATVSTKLGASGVSRLLFEETVKKFGKQACFPLYVEYVP